MGYYEKGTVLESVSAWIALGEFYAKGGGGYERDLKKAEECLRKVPSEDSGRRVDGWVTGDFELMNCASGSGEDFRLDYVRTLALNEVAAGRGDLDAKEFVAWLYAVCEDPRLLNGEKAVALAVELCSAAGTHPQRWDTLAAAYARIGDFKKAIAAQKKALELLSPMRRLSDEGQAYAKRLVLYKARKPYTTYCGVIRSLQETGGSEFSFERIGEAQSSSYGPRAQR